MIASEPLPHFVDDLLGYLHETHPTHATFDGVHIHDDLLEDFSAHAMEGEAHALSGYLRRLDEMPQFATQKTVGASTDLLATVESPLILNPVQIVAHDGRVIRPTLRGRADFVVPVQKPNPLTATIPPGDADQLRAEPRDDEAKSVFVVRQNIEQTVAPFLFATGELHR
jgi:hypothetical protein